MKKTIASIGGGLGLLLLLTSVITLSVSASSSTVFIIKMVLGVLGLTVWALWAGERTGQWVRSTFFYSTSVALSVALVGLLAAVNFIVATSTPTWDLTVNKIHSLSPQTEGALRDLKAPLEVLAFVEGPVPEGMEALFKRYAALSNQFRYQFKDPQRNPDLTHKYQLRQSQPAAVLVLHGATESHTTINLQRLSNPTLAEQELTNGILKLEQVGEQRLYFLVGHGEIPLDPVGRGEDAQMGSLMALKRALQDEGYAPQSLNLIDKDEVPRDASAVVVAGARSAISQREQTLLRNYLEQGGRLLFFAEAQAEAGLDELLGQYATQLEPGLVADAKVNPEQPYVVYTPFLGEHVITQALLKAQQNLVFATARALTILKAGTLSELTVTPLVLTTPYAWVESTLSEAPQRDSGERAGQMALAIAVTHPTAHVTPRRADEARVVVFGDSDILHGTFAYEPNRNLVLNAFAWATEQVKKITIRPRDRDVSTVDLSPEQLANIQVLSMDLFPTVLMAVGLGIWRARLSR